MDRSRACIAGSLLLTCSWLSGCEGKPQPTPLPPQDEPAGTDIWFVEEALERGIDFVHRSGHVERHLLPEIVSGGAALCDLDGDGDLDIYLVQSGSVLEASADVSSNALYENVGAGEFERRPSGAAADAGH